MLRSLTIRNYALIDSLDVEFPGGLVVISGQTGAGKSILLGALSLLTGARADALRGNESGANCVVEGEFESADGKQCIIRRVITPAGRSRAFVNDLPVGLDELREVSSTLVDIHAQFEHSSLTGSSIQLSILDGFASLGNQVSEFGKLYALRCEVSSKIGKMKKSIEEASRNKDYIEYQFDQLTKASLREGEVEELEQQQRQLGGMETINANLQKINDVFSSDEYSPLLGLRTLESSCEAIARHIPRFAELSSRIASLRVELGDIEYEISSMGSKISFSPQRLQEVDDRLAMLYDMMRKHGVSTVGDLILLRDSFASSLSLASDQSQELEHLESELKRLDKACDEAAAALSAKRKQAAISFASMLQASVRKMEMPQALFSVSVSPAPRSAKGDDAVEFMFSANEGVAPKPLAKCASGGELSRIMLCIKSLMSEYMNMPTMIFDEIDTGVSGSVADRMGQVVVEMGRRMQVFAITHLPQVASKGSSHFLVYKESDSFTTHTRVRRIEGDERVAEIARMLSGETLSDEAVANARVLLKNG